MHARRRAFQVVPTMVSPVRSRRAASLSVAVLCAVGCRAAEPPSGYPAGVRPADAASTHPGAPTVDAAPADAPVAASDAGVVAQCPCTPEDTSAIEGSSAPHDTLTLTKVTFRDLPGWTDDALAEAVPSFLRSCERLKALDDDAPVGTDGHGGKARNWR